MSGIGRVGGPNGIEPDVPVAAPGDIETEPAAAALGFGARGEAVGAIQHDLLAAGYDIGGADGIFGRATERAVADLQRRAGLPPTGSVDDATLAALATRSGPRITGPVGAGARNDPVDVRAVQRKLASLGFYGGQVDGRFGHELQRAIQLFDGVVRGLEAFDRNAADAREARTLRPGEVTERWLSAENAPRWERMPRTGVGFRNVDDEGHDWGTSWLTETVRNAGKQFEDEYRTAHPGASEILTNDASWHRGGDTLDHASHETGLDLDIRLPRKRGGTAGIKYTHPDYDRETAWAQVKAFLDQPNVERVIFNDPEIVRRAEADPRYRGRLATDPNGVHDNHVHVDVRPPAPVDA